MYKIKLSCRAHQYVFIFVVSRWNTIVVDGNDVEEICKAMYDAEQAKGKPTMILAKTFKGKGLPGIEDQMNWHGKALGDRSGPAIEAIEALMVDKNVSGEKVNMQVVTDDAGVVDTSPVKLSEAPNYPDGVKVSTKVLHLGN